MSMGPFFYNCYTVDGSIIMKCQNNEISMMTLTPNLHGELPLVALPWTDGWVA